MGLVVPATTTAAAAATTTAVAVTAATTEATTVTVTAAAETTTAAATAAAEATTAAATAAAEATAAATTRFAGASNVHGQGATLKFVIMEHGNRFLGIGFSCHLHKAKTFGAARLAVFDDQNFRYRTSLPEQILQFVLSRSVGQVTNIELGIHFLSILLY